MQHYVIWQVYVDDGTIWSTGLGRYNFVHMAPCDAHVLGCVTASMGHRPLVSILARSIAARYPCRSFASLVESVQTWDGSSWHPAPATGLGSPVVIEGWHVICPPPSWTPELPGYGGGGAPGY